MLTRPVATSTARLPFVSPLSRFARENPIFPAISLPKRDTHFSRFLEKLLSTFREGEAPAQGQRCAVTGIIPWAAGGRSLAKIRAVLLEHRPDSQKW